MVVKGGLINNINTPLNPNGYIDFTTLGRSHIYGLPCPSVDSLDPMDLYYALMFQDHPQKLPIYTYTRLLKQYPHVYATFDLKPAYIGMCEK